jgi:outer membrane lipoprotein-sorting protein
VLYQNLVTEDETDTENVEQMFMCDNDFYAIMRTPYRDDNGGNEIRCKSALVRNEKTIWVIDGFINKVLFY